MAVWKLWNSPRRKTLAVLPFLLALLYLERLGDGDGRKAAGPLRERIVKRGKRSCTRFRDERHFDRQEE